MVLAFEQMMTPQSSQKPAIHETTMAIVSALEYLWLIFLSHVLAPLSQLTVRNVKKDKVATLTNPRCIVKKLAGDDKNCVVFYGTQSGNAQDIAEKLAREANSRFSMRSMVADFDEYDYENLPLLSPNTLLCFVMASYGDGEPTDNAAQFYNILTEEESPTFQKLQTEGLQNVRFAAFGLGNSTYTFYNAVIRKVNEQLLTLGAQRLGPVGESDDSQDAPEEYFMAWKEQMWPELVKALDLKEQKAVFQPSFEVIEESIGDGAVHEPGQAVAWHSNGSDDIFFAPIKGSRRLFANSYRDCRHVELELANSDLSYQTGDHLGLYPMNPDAEVERFLRVFGLWEKRKTNISVRRTGTGDTSHIPFSSLATFESVARLSLDICGPLSRQVLATIADFVTDASQKSTLGKLGGNKCQFLELTSGKYYNLAVLLQELFGQASTVDVPFAVLLECIPKLQPRFYSISSSSITERHNPTITVAIDSFEVPGTTRWFHGVASNYMLDVASKQMGDNAIPERAATGIIDSNHPISLPISIRTSTFRLPTDLSVPVLMIGPGTGVAPFRGFIRERVKQSQSGREIGHLTLFYGCRKEGEDFLYRDEWPRYKAELGDKFKFNVAFSRQFEKKVYVQDLLRERSQEVAGIIRNNGNIYVCGDVRMGKGVYATLCGIVSQEEGISDKEAEQKLQKMKHSRFYHVRIIVTTKNREFGD